MIADPHSPVRLLPGSDGACAVGDHGGARARPRACGRSDPRRRQQGHAEGLCVQAVHQRERHRTRSTRPARARSSRTGSTRRQASARRDVDVAPDLPTFTGCVLMQLEDYSFCKRGEGRPFVDSGALSLAETAACRPTRTAAASRRRTSTGSTTWSRACARCAAIRRTRSRAPRCVWSRARRAFRRAP